MRTGSITVLGKNYPLCFSARVIKNFEEKFDCSIGELYNVLGQEGKTVENAFWLLSEMSKAGSRYKELADGEEAPKPLDVDFLFDIFGVDDIANLKNNIFTTIKGGVKREVDAVEDENENEENEKKQKAVPKEEVK